MRALAKIPALSRLGPEIDRCTCGSPFLGSLFAYAAILVAYTLFFCAAACVFVLASASAGRRLRRALLDFERPRRPGAGTSDDGSNSSARMRRSFRL